jgi:HTH-type transcriptional regulator / antitoxin HigA
MATSDLSRVERVWPALAPLLYVPHSERDSERDSEREYEALVELLDALIDLVGEDETHPLASLMVADGGCGVADRAL